MAKPKTSRPITDIRPPATERQHEPNWHIAVSGKIVVIVAVIVIILLGSGLYLHHRHTVKPSGQSQIDQTVNQVSKLFLLPTGEQPTLAIVNDASKYNNVAFFKNAANGDRLLVYAQAHEAILYRPSINKIIAVAPLSVNAQASGGNTSQ